MLTRLPYFVYTHQMPITISPYEMYDEGAELIQEIKNKLGDKIVETLGEDLSNWIDDFLYEHERYWDDDEDEEEEDTEDVLPNNSEGETD